MASSLTFLERHHEFFDHIVLVTGDETWVLFVNVETKEQSKYWMHTHSPNNPKKFKEICGRKLMTTVFWDRKVVPLVDFMQ
jgi:hypothetical protein